MSFLKVICSALPVLLSGVAFADSKKPVNGKCEKGYTLVSSLCVQDNIKAPAGVAGAAGAATSASSATSTAIHKAGDTCAKVGDTQGKAGTIGYMQCKASGGPGSTQATWTTNTL